MLSGGKLVGMKVCSRRKCCMILKVAIVFCGEGGVVNLASFD